MDIKPTMMHEIVMRLIGSVSPTGDHNTDQQRLANMKVLTELVDRLLFVIVTVTPAVTSTEASVKAIGIHAEEFLQSVKECD